jgi:hypothetical protein
MSNPKLPGDLKSLPDALRALPQVAPERSAWPQLAAQLAAQGLTKAAPAVRASSPARRNWRWAVPTALAAGIVLAAVAWPLLQRPAPSTGAPVATVAAPGASIQTNAANSANTTSTQSAEGPRDVVAQLAALQQHSQALEHWLHETGRAAAPLSGQDLAAAAEIEDMIGLVDGQLNGAPKESEVPLWRRRVALLEDLTALRYSSYKLAETGVALR